MYCIYHYTVKSCNIWFQDCQIELTPNSEGIYGYKSNHNRVKIRTIKEQLLRPDLCKTLTITINQNLLVPIKNACMQEKKCDLKFLSNIPRG